MCDVHHVRSRRDVVKGCVTIPVGVEIDLLVRRQVLSCCCREGGCVDVFLILPSVDQAVGI